MDWLERLTWFPLNEFPFVVISLVLAFTIHEFAHAYSAYKFGDNTAYDAGRVTLNPAAHLDVIGTILIFLVGFGWAKPVPVNRGRFKHPRLMGIVVSAVGPLSNLFLAAVGILLAVLVFQTGWMINASIGVQSAVETFLEYLIVLNIGLFLFNLIPLPPLDGYRIIQDLVPLRVRLRMDENVQWGMFLFLLIVFIPPLRAVTLTPLFNLTEGIIAGIAGFYGLFY
ncbi:zinc metalloprotease [Paenibacillus darwinianus]|uniref:Zinc metalloprotease n=1 Tax=Paenibacillus darwinianus TaxID=1380763 RepID=A0A9W5S072_9BACL|nr:site-2 protease family protein [Paenibacillus darwinianus]EXX87976.1 zinc metalloprotease [Paenibacillus darwinianus]EXX88036.1 zinc metalloprotease [Paenibacillus darwinianus]EXX89204.1 zinc metalloprotease [Paenibacillus darwinianus]